jgi:DNA-directed RNA polymerase specialized sigma24 family protein
LDPVLPAEHFECAWRTARPHARRIIGVALERFPLSSLQRIASTSLVQVRRPTNSAVRRSLANDRALVDEVEQEVAIGFWHSIVLGRVRAALPVIIGWLNTAVPRIVRKCARQAALLKLFAPPTEESAEFEEGISLPVDCGISFDERRSECHEALAILVETHPELTAALASAERAAFELWIGGIEPRNIAGILGIRSGTARVRLLRARKRIVELASRPSIRPAA